MTEHEFNVCLARINIFPTEKQLSQLEQYYQLTKEYNKVMNLTGITDKPEFYLKHFYDSATIAQIINLNDITTMCDIGSGAGFPGIVVKILFPHIKITLLDSLNKRVEFLNKVISELKLDGIEAVHDRAEVYARKYQNSFELTVARAVAQTNTLLEYAIPMTKIKGYFVAMKGNLTNEKDYANACHKLLCREIKKIEFDLPKEQGKRSLILFLKDKDTPSKYPRENKLIKNNPL